MKIHTFRGGIHPDDAKSLTSGKPIINLSPCKTYIIPLSQHIGAPNKPLVKPGDHVFLGQKIGDSDAYVSAPVHSSVSGTVKEITKHLTPSGQECDCIIIENDFKEELDPSVRKLGGINSVTSEQIVKAVRDAGIVGMGGAGFPTHVKITPPKEDTIDTVIVNGAECEPFLTSDHRVMLERPYEVINGLRLLMKAVKVKRGVIAIEENKPDAIKLLTEKTAEFPEIEICILKTKYPQGSEKHIIKAVTGREVKSGKLPSSAGVVVVNIDTCTACARRVLEGMPLIRRIVTLSGNCFREPANYRVKIGTPFSYLIEQAGGFSKEPAKLIMGGPMMGITQYSLDVPVVKGTGAVLAFDESWAKSYEEKNCTRCGRCIKACPMGLAPVQLNLYSVYNDLDAAQKANVMDCIECGACTYVCPCRRQLVQRFRVMKQKIQEIQKKEAAK